MNKVSIKNLYTVKQVPYEQIKEWLLYKHYAHRIPSISYSFGLYDVDNILQGICTFGSPPSHALCVGICGKKFSERVVELNRLCVNQKEKNQSSYFLGKCFKLLPQPLILVSYADTSQNHHGYIYQATNWIYTGLSAKRTERYDPNNPNKHSKTVTGTMSYKDLSVRERPQKHRYIMFLGDKKQKKEMLFSLKYEIKPYPKGDNKNYDASYTPRIQKLLF
jgi:hypothetical protein